MRRPRSWLAVPVLAALAGCGSTVAAGPTAGSSALALSGNGLGSSSTVPGGTGGISAGGTGGLPGGPAGAPGTAVAAGGAAGTGGGTAPGSTGTAAAGSGPAGGGPGGLSPGVTAATITVGVSYAANAGAANSAIGGKGITTGNEPADARIVLDDINRHGGVLGRRLVPLFYQRDAQSTDPVANQAQAECSFYTQDHHVFAVLLGNGPLDWAEKPCLNKAGVPALTSHIASLDDDTPQVPDNADVAGMSEQHLAQAQLGAISRLGWLSPWNATTGSAGTAPAKVGVVSYDLPAVDHAVDRVLLPGLARLGARVAAQDVFRIAIPQATSDDAAAQAALQDAVLKLRNDGVDHVVLVDNGGAMSLLFANNAYSQHYLPRYAGTSSNGFEALLAGGDIQPAVLAGLAGAGWEPVIDLPHSDSGPWVTPTRTACLALLRAGGQSFSDGNSEAVALGYCDKLALLRQALAGAGAPSLSAYLAGLDRVGSFATSRGLGSRFSPGRHDGAAAWVAMDFDAACGCARYVGSRQDLS